MGGRLLSLGKLVAKSQVSPLGVASAASAVPCMPPLLGGPARAQALPASAARATTLLLTFHRCSAPGHQTWVNP